MNQYKRTKASPNTKNETERLIDKNAPSIERVKTVEERLEMAISKINALIVDNGKLRTAVVRMKYELDDIRSKLSKK